MATAIRPFSQWGRVGWKEISETLGHHNCLSDCIFKKVQNQQPPCLLQLIELAPAEVSAALAYLFLLVEGG